LFKKKDLRYFFALMWSRPLAGNAAFEQASFFSNARFENQHGQPRGLLHVICFAMLS
jgi:hypothetical protein